MPTSISTTAVVDPRAEIGEGTVIGDFVVLGREPLDPAHAPLRIGIDARIRSHTVIYAGTTIGDRFQTGHGVMIREGNEIGSDVSVGTHSIVEHHVVIGDGARIHSNAFIPEFSVLEERAWIGPSVTFTSACDPLSPGAKANLRGPIVRRGAKIGANATLLPGVIIGRDALVGAGSVVVRDVPDGAVVVGNPARVIKLAADIRDYHAG